MSTTGYKSKLIINPISNRKYNLNIFFVANDLGISQTTYSITDLSNEDLIAPEGETIKLIYDHKIKPREAKIKELGNEKIPRKQVGYYSRRLQ